MQRRPLALGGVEATGGGGRLGGRTTGKDGQRVADQNAVGHERSATMRSPAGRPQGNFFLITRGLRAVRFYLGSSTRLLVAREDFHSRDALQGMVRPRSG